MTKKSKSSFTQLNRKPNRNRSDRNQVGVKMEPTDATIEKELQVWKQAMDALGESTHHGRTAEPADIQRAEEVAKYLLGYASLRFAGPGEINGVVNVDQTPDERENPRALDEEHVKKLFVRFSQGDIKDRPSPIRIIAPADGIDNALLEKMKSTKPSDSTSAIPFLELKRPNAERQRELERDIFYRFNLVTGKSLLSGKDVENRSEELRELRSMWELARLLNGNHRINAILQVTDLLKRKVEDIINAQQNQQKTLNEIREALDQLNYEVNKAAYIVEVYSADTPNHVRVWLAENEENRPNRPPQAGENVRLAIRAQEALVQKMLDTDKASDRIEALDMIMAVIERKKPINGPEDQNILTCMQGLARLKDSGIAASHSKETTKRLGIFRLILNPAANAMAVDTYQASWVYDELMVESHIDAMRKDLGAPLIAHYWMSIRLLLKIINVSHAVRHWINLHKHAEDTPALLSRYGNAQASRFQQAIKRAQVGSPDYTDANYILALRRAFWAFGQGENDSHSEAARRVSTAIRLYALLPLWEKGCDETHFFPAALLPNRNSAARYVENAKTKTNSDAWLWMLESLLDEHQLIWTAGTIGSSMGSNTASWTNRARGGHQLLLRLTQATKSSSLYAQLQIVFDSPNFFTAIDSINKYLAIGKRISTLKEECSVARGGITYCILPKIINRAEDDTYGSFDAAKRRLLEARMAPRTSLFKGNGSIGNTLKEHPILRIIPSAWWKSIKVEDWVKGWNDATDKELYTIGSLIGWGLATQEVMHYILPEAIRNVPAAVHLLNAVRTVHEAENSQPWWIEQADFRPSSLPSNEGGRGQTEALKEEAEVEARIHTEEDSADRGSNKAITPGIDSDPVKEATAEFEALHLSSRLQNEIDDHRLDLGRRMVKFVREFRQLANGFPGPLEYTLAPLVGDLVLFRSIFISEVTQSIQTHNPEGQPQTEAISVAESDGLYHESVIRLNAARGTLELDLRHIPFQAVREEIENDKSHHFRERRPATDLVLACEYQDGIILVENEVLKDGDKVHRVLASMGTYMPIDGPGFPLSLVEGQCSGSVHEQPGPITRAQKRKSDNLDHGPRGGVPTKRSKSRASL